MSIGKTLKQKGKITCRALI